MIGIKRKINKMAKKNGKYMLKSKGNSTQAV